MIHLETHGNTEQTPHHLVLIHGWGMHGGVWQPLIKTLSKQYCVHIVDLPGMGFSPSTEPYHLPALAERVLEVIPAQSDICGWSLGGLVAMQLAMMQPERVRRLVVVGGTPCFVNGDEFEGRAAWQYGVDGDVFYQFAQQIKQDYQSTLIKFLSLQCMGSSDSRNTIKQLRESFATRPTPTGQTLQQGLRVLMETDLRPDLERIRKPVLLVHGDRDSLAPVQAANWLAQHLPFARLRVISGAGHAPFLSHGTQFIETLAQFLEPSR